MTFRSPARRLPVVWLIVALLASALSILMAERQKEAGLAADHFRVFVSQMDPARYPEAKLEIEKAVSLSPGNAYYASSFGLLEERMTGRSFDSRLHQASELYLDEQEKLHAAAAIRWYEKALELNRNDASFHHNLGWLSAFLKENEQALEHFNKALLLQPNNALYRISRGLFFERSGNHEALSDYSIAVRLSPGVVDSRFYSDLHKRMPSAEEEVVGRAITDLEGLEEADPVLKARLAKLYLYSDRVEALDLLKQVTVELPNLPRPWLHLGILYERQREYEEAERCYEKAAFLGGDYSALLHLGGLHDRAERTGDAIRCYQAAINNWRAISSESARNAPRVYHASDIVADNIVPRGFLAYVEPDFDLRTTCLRLAELHRSSGNVEQANYYEALGKRAGL
ncbi:MAG TPA: tetratricopeptide repeat protein [Blastocatellia bacterium]|nr:tetratricopeptide repeat protein [Blastocatellia bacterium]